MKRLYALFAVLLALVLSLSCFTLVSAAGETKAPHDCSTDHPEIEGEWQPLTSQAIKDGLDGNYYLASDFSFSTGNMDPHSIFVGEGKTVNLCLNGHKLNSYAKTNPVIVNGDGATLNIYDCPENTGAIVAPADFSGSYPCIYVLNGTLNMYGGGIKNFKSTSTTPVGGGAIGLSPLSDATVVFNMYGGEISGNCSNFGAGIYARYGSTINLYGGKITNNTAKEAGGGIYLSYGYGEDDYRILNVGKDAQVTGNKLQPSGKAAVDCDVQFVTGEYPIMGGIAFMSGDNAPTEAASVGLYTNNGFNFFTSGKNNLDCYEDVFFANNPDHRIVYSESDYQTGYRIVNGEVEISSIPFSYTVVPGSVKNVKVAIDNDDFRGVKLTGFDCTVGTVPATTLAIGDTVTVTAYFRLYKNYQMTWNTDLFENADTDVIDAGVKADGKHAGENYIVFSVLVPEKYAVETVGAHTTFEMDEDVYEVGEEVYFMMEHDPAYNVVSVTVKKADDSRTVVPCQNEEDFYYFTMPAYNVKIVVQYEGEETYDVYTNGANTVFLVEKKEYQAGETVRFTLDHQTGITVKSVEVLKDEDATVKTPLNYDETTGKYSFTMPDYPVKINVTYEGQNEEQNDGSPEGEEAEKKSHAGLVIVIILVALIVLYAAGYVLWMKKILLTAAVFNTVYGWVRPTYDKAATFVGSLLKKKEIGGEEETPSAPTEEPKAEEPAEEKKDEE